MCMGEIGEVVDVVSGHALVSVRGRTRSINLLTLREPLQPRDWVVVHAGFALARLTADEARDAITLRTSPTTPEAC